ncbi:MAG: hydantoinase B/oxoprolinase family protein [Pseudomonadota bacterium]
MLEFWIDRGGTFTDVIACSDRGQLHALKVLSERPGREGDAALEGMTRLARQLGYASLCEAPVRAIRMGTTVATNALLERRGERSALLITAGLRDALIIGEQHRPDIFALDVRRAPPLFERIIEVDERCGPAGDIERPLDETALRAELHAAAAAGIGSVAIVLLNAHVNATHETRCAAFAREAGFLNVSVSHEISGLAKLVARGDTTVADAYLTPILRRYTEQLSAGVGERHAGALRFMQSNGGLTTAERFRGANSVLSGPAGGVVGMVRTAAVAGIDQVIGFDMGGTSTDIALYDRAYERAVDNVIDSVRLQTPMLRVHTIAAGGGSVLSTRDGRLQVGPESAGAMPGPRCYGQGGPLAVTDIQACLGRLQPDFFPPVFGRQGDAPLDPTTSRAGFVDLLAGQSGRTRTPEALAGEFLDVAINAMALAVKQAAFSRGIDVERFTLASFGGAAGQHACAVARRLGLKSILVHPEASVLSALGIGLADHRSIRMVQVNAPLNETNRARSLATSEPIADALRATLATEGDVRIVRRWHLRLADSDTTLPLGDADATALATAFHDAHHDRFGFRGDADIMIDSIGIEAIVDGALVPMLMRARPATSPSSVSRRPVWFDGAWQSTPIYKRDHLSPDTRLTGPALIVDQNSTIVVEPEWTVQVRGDGQLMLEDQRAQPQRPAPERHAEPTSDPASLEQFNARLMHIAQQMGTVLKNTARSVNIKERLDFSCAVFDADGNLLANAPHMPVHLGSMGDSVRAATRAFPDLAAGDCIVLNDPYDGGTHLPDITVVSPLLDANQTVRFFVASRGHHADVGGLTPGSMPATSEYIDQEGVLLAPRRIVRNGQFDEPGLRRALCEAPYPARNVDQNIADLKAQLAANQKGLSLLDELLTERGPAYCSAYARHVQDNASVAVRRVIETLRDGHRVVEMDGGHRIEVRVAIRGDRALVDFTGTSAQASDNFNAPSSVCRAAVLYVFRCLVSRSIPMNEGCLDPITLTIPDGCFLAPRSPAAVAAGNVETSMCVTEALFGALGVLAAGQGTMNNITFGNERVQYYETLCGGAGAGNGFDGGSAIHTHMTNSRLTDPEILEERFPVRITEFRVREGSGGRGQWCGGDGLIREYEFLEAMNVSLLTNTRRRGARGLAGGGSGDVGRNILLPVDAQPRILDSTAHLTVQPGDRLRIETPGGGGFGRAGDEGPD